MAWGASSAKSTTFVRRRAGKPIVLFLDDDEDGRAAHAMALREADFDVREAGSVEEANAVLGEIMPQVIIADRSLPDGDGFKDFVALLRRDPKFAEVPCIALTGASRAADIESAVLSGCDVYLVKPVSPEVLVARVRERSTAPVRQRRGSV